MTETATLTLTDFLLARIAEDEARARMSGPGARWRTARLLWDQSTRRGNWHHVPQDQQEEWAKVGDRVLVELVGGCYWDPARVLAECAAKRRVVAVLTDVAEHFSADTGAEGPWAVDEALRALALPYADHADYREEWRV